MNCGNCKHWNIIQTEKETDDLLDEWADCLNLGECSKIIHGGMGGEIVRENDNERFMASTFDGEDYCSGIITNKNFGCLLFELIEHGAQHERKQYY